jgi:cytidylate kinase
MSFRSIAIDGPSGAGKSTLAKMAAAYYGYIYLDTGAIYRSVGLYALRKGVSSKDAEAIEALLKDIDIEIHHDGKGTQRILLNGEDVSGEIRSPKASIYASDVSAIPAVRSFLLEKQRDFAKKADVIMDGRDIGTVVLPDADVKVFLTAKPEIRARRRFEELTASGSKVTYEEVLSDLLYRDKNDSSRKQAPLRPAENAVIIDTTDTDLKGSFELIKKVIEERTS